jgi:hypothetical protein
MLAKPRANLGKSRYDFARDTLRTLALSLPSNLVFDVGPVVTDE